MKWTGLRILQTCVELCNRSTDWKEFFSKQIRCSEPRIGRGVDSSLRAECENSSAESLVLWPWGWNYLHLIFFSSQPLMCSQPKWNARLPSNGVPVRLWNARTWILNVLLAATESQCSDLSGVGGRERTSGRWLTRRGAASGMICGGDVAEKRAAEVWAGKLNYRTQSSGSFRNLQDLVLGDVDEIRFLKHLHSEWCAD